MKMRLSISETKIPDILFGIFVIKKIPKNPIKLLTIREKYCIIRSEAVLTFAIIHYLLKMMKIVPQDEKISTI